MIPALIAGDVNTLERLLRENEQLREQYPGGARAIILRAHHFENWAKFEEYLEARKRTDSPLAQFEAAADAIVSGDVTLLQSLLRANPELIHARSTRRHHATLLHYAGSNGVEDFRQKTPKNIETVVESLINAGAEVDAVADMYGGGCTTLGLAATSIHPLQAGVLAPLIEVLLKNGATVDAPSPGSIVNACLANGRPEGAELMAGHGAKLDLEGAAGLGRIEVVKTCFNEDGSLRPPATREQMHRAFAWACEYGRTSVVTFLLQHGVDLAAPVKPHGQTGLHWAAYCAHSDIVRLLLNSDAPVDAQDETWGTTPLGWALHAWRNLSPGATPGQYQEVVALLVAAGAQVQPDWIADDKVRANPGMLAALGFREES
jgi:hypothetical protein